MGKRDKHKYDSSEEEKTHHNKNVSGFILTVVLSNLSY